MTTESGYRQVKNEEKNLRNAWAREEVLQGPQPGVKSCSSVGMDPEVHPQSGMGLMPTSL